MNLRNSAVVLDQCRQPGRDDGSECLGENDDLRNTLVVLRIGFGPLHVKQNDPKDTPITGLCWAVWRGDGYNQLELDCHPVKRVDGHLRRYWGKHLG